jgi:hypothetical protein
MCRIRRVPSALDNFFRTLHPHFRWAHGTYVRLVVLAMSVMWGATEQSSPTHPGSSSLLIPLAKSDLHTIYVRHELENQVCQRISSYETDFASSITFGEMGQSWMRYDGR